MSMKRARRVNNTARGSQGESSFAFGKEPATHTWAELTDGKPDSAFKPYAVSATYAKNDLVSHPKFGKGVVTMVEGTRVEVLFADGSKKLGHSS